MKFNWQNLPKPFFALAPMEGGTDIVFRQIVSACGKPDVMFTEFTNCEGILSKAREAVGRRLVFADTERPLIAQIWGKNPESFFKVSKLLVEMGFDGIDINMGCPEKKVVAHGSCSALIEQPELAAEIIKSTREGAGSASRRIPVSVKTRVGFKTFKTEEWISFLLQQKLDAITIHFRIQKEMSKFPARWEEAKIISKIKDQISNKTVIIGNGDVETKAQGRELAERYGLDGIMIGRGAFHNPYVFNENINYNEQTKEQRIELLKKHLDLFVLTWTCVHPLSEKAYQKSYAPLKRFFKIYINGFEGASDLREKLMETQNIDEARLVLDGIKN